MSSNATSDDASNTGPPLSSPGYSRQSGSKTGVIVIGALLLVVLGLLVYYFFFLSSSSIFSSNV